MPTRTNKFIRLFFILTLLAFAFTFQSCKKNRSDMGKTLALKTKNKVFEDATPEGFAIVFKQVLAKEGSKITYPKIIDAYYKQNEYDPELVMDHIFNGDLQTM